MSQQTKKVRQTTIEEYEAPIVEKEKEIEIKPATTAAPVGTISPENDFEDVDLQSILKQAIADYDLETAKLILRELTHSPVEQAIIFLQAMPEGEQATIMIERLPDSMNQRGVFCVPCDVPIKLANYTWYSQNADESDLYNRLNAEHGGGNYRFEIRYHKGFTGLIWKETLADSHEWIARHRQASENAELARLKTELEKIKLEKSNSPATADTSAEFTKLQVELAKMQGENQLALAEIKHQFEVEKIKLEAEKSKAADTPLALLQVASQTKNTELVQVAKDLIFDQKKGFADYVFETLDNPERLEAVSNVGIKVGTALLGFLFPGQVPSGTTSTNPPQESKTPAELYKERLAARQSTAQPSGDGSPKQSSNSKPKKEK